MRLVRLAVPRRLRWAGRERGILRVALFLKGQTIDRAGPPVVELRRKKSQQSGAANGARIRVVCATFLSHLDRRRIIFLLAGEIRWPIKRSCKLHNRSRSLISGIRHRAAFVRLMIFPFVN